MIKFTVQHTDTFGGEANYSWVKNHTLELKNSSRLAIVRAAKKVCGFNGVKSQVTDYGDLIEIRPIGYNQIAFVEFPD